MAPQPEPTPDSSPTPLPGADCPSQGAETPSRFQLKAMWAALTALALVVIGAISVGGIALLSWVLSFLQPVLVPLAAAAIIAYLLEPLVGLLTQRGWKRNSATLLVFCAFLLALVLLAVAVIVPTFGQASELITRWDDIQARLVENAKSVYSSARERLGSPVAQQYYDKGVDWISTEAPRWGGQVLAKLTAWITTGLGLLGYVIGFALVPVYLYYFMKEAPVIASSWSDYLPLRASRFKNEVVETLQEINGYLVSFFRGQMLVSLIDGALVGIALSLIGLPYGLLIGVFVGLLGLLPYIGNLLCLIPAVLISIWHFGAKKAITEADLAGYDARRVVTDILPDGTNTYQVYLHTWSFLPTQVWAYPLIVLGLFFIVQQINGLFTAPRIVGESVGLHPLTVIFAVLFWSLVLGGLLGALLAVPLTAALKVLFRRYVWERKLSPAAREAAAEGGKEKEKGKGEAAPAPM